MVSGMYGKFPKDVWSSLVYSVMANWLLEMLIEMLESIPTIIRQMLESQVLSKKYATFMKLTIVKIRLRVIDWHRHKVSLIYIKHRINVMSPQFIHLIQVPRIIMIMSLPASALPSIIVNKIKTSFIKESNLNLQLWELF